MAEKKETEEKKGNVEREYTIPLRNKVNRVPSYKRANKAMKTIKEFVARHMKIRDRDLNKVKLDKYINEEVWFRGIKNPPSKIKVKVRMEGTNAMVELFDLHEKAKFKKAREEKLEKVAKEKATPKTAPITETKEDQKSEEKVGEKKEESSEDSKESKEEAKEKKSAVVEAGQKLEKADAKMAKHQTKQSKQPKHQIRKALKK